MQIYKGMNIATAKPDEQEKQGIPHWLTDFLPSDKTYSVADFVSDAASCIEDIVSRGKMPIIAGGTGLYVDSLLNGISFEKQERNEEISNFTSKTELIICLICLLNLTVNQQKISKNSAM